MGRWRPPTKTHRKCFRVVSTTPTSTLMRRTSAGGARTGARSWIPWSFLLKPSATPRSLRSSRLSTPSSQGSTAPPRISVVSAPFKLARLKWPCGSLSLRHLACRRFLGHGWKNWHGQVHSEGVRRTTRRLSYLPGGLPCHICLYRFVCVYIRLYSFVCAYMNLYRSVFVCI